MSRLSLLVVSTWLLVSTSVQASENNWTGWLGPERNGWVESFTPPQQWPETLQEDWQIHVGTGYGSPLVVGHRVLMHTRQGDKEVVRALDISSGAEAWQQSDPVPFKMGGGGERHGKGPKSCPVYADGRLFTLSITGILRAWTTETGERLWERDFADEFQSNQPYWGVSTSPIVVDGLVIAHFGNDEQGALLALDAVTGKERWRHGNDGTSYSSPVLADFCETPQIVEWNHRALVSVDAKTGVPLWEVEFPHEGHNQNMPTPVLFEDRVVLGGENRGIHCYFPQRNADGEWSVTETWEQPELALDMSTPILNGKFLYGFSHYNSGQLFCLDPADGTVLWRGSGRAGQNATFLSVPGFVLGLMDHGKLHVIEAGGEKTSVVRSYPVSQNPTWAPPVLLSDGFLIKDRDMLIRWKFR